MDRLAAAIERRDWDTVALYLLLGTARTAARLPAGTAADLLTLLDPVRRGDGTA